MVAKMESRNSYQYRYLWGGTTNYGNHDETSPRENFPSKTRVIGLTLFLLMTALLEEMMRLPAAEADGVPWIVMRT